MRTPVSGLLVAFLLVLPSAALAQSEETAPATGGDKLEEAAPEPEAPASDEAAPSETPAEETPPAEGEAAADGAAETEGESAEDASDGKLEDEAPEETKETDEAESLPDPKVGDDVGGWTLIAITSEKRLPDGRATEEPCGYIRDAVAEKGPRVEKVELLVPCISTPDGLRAGAARLRFDEPPAPEPEEEPASAEPAPEAEPEAEPAPEAEAEAEPEAVEEETPPADVEPREGPSEEEDDGKPKKPFLKGELTHFGETQLLNKRSSIGLGLGWDVIGDVHYARIRPDLNVRWGPFGLGLGAPLRFQVLDLSEPLNLNDPQGSIEGWTTEAGRFRSEDWDQIEDFLRPLRYLTWGKKEDRFYADLNRVHAKTVGHGQLMRRYSPTVDIDEDNLFAEVDGYLDFGGFELVAGPFPIPRVAGGLVFIKPLGLFLDDYVSKSWSVGFSYLTDLNTPTVLTTSANPADGRTQLPVDDAGQFVFDNKEAFLGDQVQGFGVDTELKVLKWEFIDLKLYADWSQLLMPAVGASPASPTASEAFTDGGFTLGTLIRMSFGSKFAKELKDETEEARTGKVPREMKAEHALRLRLEGRTFGPQYLPSYFDTLYEADKWQFGFGGLPTTQRAQLPTKLAWLASQEGQAWRTGFYAEASYSWVDWLGFTAMYEDAITLDGQAVPAARNMAFHVETGPGVGFLQVFATYHYRHFDDFSKLFQFGSDNEVFYFGGRLSLLPILSINVQAQRAFRLGFSPDDLPGQKSPLPGAASGSTEYRYSSIGLQNDWAFGGDVEIGWQF
jgi:hypothetical protein